ncbi:MAG: ABC transporter substrate-binding protein [Pseudomonadota bacterium]
MEAAEPEKNNSHGEKILSKENAKQPQDGKTPTWRVSRRSFMKGATTTAIAATIAGPVMVTPGKAQASTVIRFADDGGRTGEGRAEHFVKPFMEATGIEVRTFVGQKDLAKMKAMVRTGNLEFDVITDGGSFLSPAGKDGLLEELDTSKLDLSTHLFPQWVWEHHIAWQYFSGGLGYNSDSITDAPTSWAEYWDIERFPGRRGFRTRPQYTLEEALQADGVDPKDLYPLDVDRAFASLDRIKNDVRIWISETAKTIEHLQTNELDYASTFSGRVLQAQGEGLPIGFAFEMTNSEPLTAALMKGAENQDACLQLVQWFLTGESADGWFNAFGGYGPADSKIMDKLPESVTVNLPDPLNPKANWVDVDWWGENLEEVSKRYKEWLLT